MGFLSNRVERDQIKAGDHIYTWRGIYTYSHHGIYVGGFKVVHFRRKKDVPSESFTSLDSSDSPSQMCLSSCKTFPDCGFSLPYSGVVLTCLECFLYGGSLYCYEYGVAPSYFLAKVRGGTCTTAESDPTATVIHRAMYLLQKGFGKYDLFQNNCEDFALHCKTGPIGVATVTAGMYCMSRYATDIGVRTDVVKVPVEEIAMNQTLTRTDQDTSEKYDHGETIRRHTPPEKKSRTHTLVAVGCILKQIGMLHWV